MDPAQQQMGGGMDKKRRLRKKILATHYCGPSVTVAIADDRTAHMLATRAKSLCSTDELT